MGTTPHKGWYSRLVDFKVEDLFLKKREPGPPRTVYVHERPTDQLDSKGKIKKEFLYVTNQVITSKYNIITFLPRNLLEQFRRVANIYFLAIAILQFFPKFTTISPGVAILPLIFIIAVTALKDGYEDFQRHQSDKRVNYGKTHVLSGGDWLNPNASHPKSKTFIRGIVPPQRKRDADTDLPKDSSSIPDGDSDETSTSQAEGGLRPYWKATLWEDVRVGDFVKIFDDEAIPADIVICATSEDEDLAFVETKGLDGETNLKSRHAVSALSFLRSASECAKPQNSFQIRCDRPDTDMYRFNANASISGKTTPVDLSMTLLRGTVLRNTKWVIGLVVFTGSDTKIVLNSGGTPSKRSKVEKQMNPQVFINLLLLVLMAIVCGVADSIIERRYVKRDAPWLLDDNTSGDNPSINGVVTWAFALLTFQDIVPISLYISIEFVRTCQAAFIYFDADICYEKNKQATIARTWNLSDDLGQIEYIFSDKTGTLTQNLMVFRQCTIGGRAYRGTAASDEPQELDDVKVPSDLHGIEANPVAIDIWSVTGQLPGSSRVNVTPQESQDKSSPAKEVIHFKDSNLERDLQDALVADENSPNASHARSLNGFFTVLSLCHTVLTAVDPESGKIQYKAQSPDEAALVQAAADVGFVFLGKDREILSLRTPSSLDVEKYELLNILEFTSARKRMSVVLRRVDVEDQRLFLLTKGADNVIFERLKDGEEELKRETEHHLSEFANTGLRTLTLAYKVISEDFYREWNARYHEAENTLENREEKIETVSNELEQELRLLGATAIEDKLQDGVPETIADLKRAGIKIWVATGDKMETAIAIGRSTNLISNDSNIIVIRGGRRPVHQQMIAAIQQFFPDSEAKYKKESIPRSPLRSPHGDGLYRVNTGVSSIVGAENGDRTGGFVLVIDGAALLQAFSDEENKSTLLQLAMLCEGVICCRVSPLQKALIVRLVKDGLGVMTLAIGDGANDVSMIQAAHVGVGISGEEGLQAVNSSDYAIAQFRFLKKLLLVHGHWSYARNGNMILNFFYKNVVPTGILWWYQIYSAWSGYYVFDYTYILFWNSLWTILPVIGIGLFDRIMDAKVLMQLPELYHFGREGYWFGTKSFMVFLFDGIVQSAIIFFLLLYTYVSTTSRKDGFDIHQQEMSTTMAMSSVVVANLFALMTSSAWTLWLAFTIAFGIVVVWVFTAIYALVTPGFSVTQLYGLDDLLFKSAYFWLGLLVTLVLALAPRYIAKAWKYNYNPDDLDIVRWIRKTDPSYDLSSYAHGNAGIGLAALKRRPSSASHRTSPMESVVTLEQRLGRQSIDARMASRTDMSTGLVSVDRGFDFATEERGVEMRRIQTNLSERRSSSRHLELRPKSRKGKETLSQVFSLRRKRRSPKKDE